ncbi:NEDD8-specific protease 1-like [Cucurbita moschata]|uniref:NEDD8-specific protease 1-like n=1 Tax=Cucurbita moschata TaxID=3662 RepID=A0A6J1GPM3_CUCMO|nr:NEDD8-specific protease 1-like [Cucurbita moschata]
MAAKFLTYGDVVIQGFDLHSLEGRNYLNDTIIDFYFAYLSATYQSNEILSIPTSVSFLLGNTLDWDIFISTIESLNLHEKKLIFFVVNDNSNVSSSGGSHWSLLVYCRKRNLFMHYDSLSTMNSEPAFTLYESVSGYINYDPAEFMECRAPRQNNGYDCGLYVMETARVIYEHYFNVDQFRSKDEISGPINVMRSVKSKYVESNMRSEMMQLIRRLKQEQEQINSR